MGLGGKAQVGIKKIYAAFHLIFAIAYQSCISPTGPPAAADEGAVEGAAAAACPSPLERFRQKRPKHAIVDCSPFLHKSG